MKWAKYLCIYFSESRRLRNDNSVTRRLYLSCSNRNCVQPFRLGKSTKKHSLKIPSNYKTQLKMKGNVNLNCD